jgi:hypothetical protein
MLITQYPLAESVSYETGSAMPASIPWRLSHIEAAMRR